MRIGNSANTAAEVYADGGSIKMPNERFMVGTWNTAGGSATLTVDGNAEMEVGILGLGICDDGKDVAGTAVLNLNGGALKTERGIAHYSKAKPTRRINFDGGTFEGSIGDFPTTVYPDGGTIKITAGGNDYGFQPRLATGYGVSSVTLTDSGSGYVTVPQVKISGGQGQGATAYAVLAKDRTLEKIVVTCRGEGYAADDVLTVEFVSTTGSGAAATVTLAANGTGTIRKTGAGVWYQTANSSFAGDISIEEGSLGVDGISFSALKSLSLKDGASLKAARSGTDGESRSSSVNRVDIRNAVGSFQTDGEAGTGSLRIGALNLDCGLALVPYVNKGLALALTDTSLSSASSAESPIVHGVVYSGMDSSTYRSPSLFERKKDGSLALIETTSELAQGANFSPAAGVCLADGESGVGVIETSGTIDRAPGIGKGELCWKRHECYPSSYGLRGGFAAFGGDLTVNLGGDARKLVCGADYLPANTVVQLQSYYADGALIFANGFELGGLTQAVNVWAEKTAVLSGVVSDNAGSGQLAVKGDIMFTGTLEIAGKNLDADKPLLSVDGALDLTGAQVDVKADSETLAYYKLTGAVLASATGGITGIPVFKTPLSGGWQLRVKDGELLLNVASGTVIILR